MGFSFSYRTTRPVSDELAATIQQEVNAFSSARTWLSCEPLNLGRDRNGHLLGSSKPAFELHPDDTASADKQGLPDGTVRDLLESLCVLSRNYGVDWEISHDYSEVGAVGFIRRGICDGQLIRMADALVDMLDALLEMDEFDEPGSPSKKSSQVYWNDESIGEDDDEAEDEFPPTIRMF